MSTYQEDCLNSAKSCADPHCRQHRGSAAIPLPEPSTLADEIESVFDDLDARVRDGVLPNETTRQWWRKRLLAALRPSEGPPASGCPECGWNDEHSPQCSRTGLAPSSSRPSEGPETGDWERLRAEARARHDACVLGHLSNTTGHVSPFIWCPHPACVLVRQAAPAASEGQK